MDFGTRLRQLRLAKGVSMKELSDLVDMDPSAVSNYESGRRRPDFDTLLESG